MPGKISNKTEIFDKEDTNKKQTIVATLKNRIAPILPTEILAYILFEVIGDNNTLNTADEKLYITLEFLCDPNYEKIHNHLINFIYSQCDLCMKGSRSPYEKLADMSESNKALELMLQKCYRKDRTNTGLIALKEMVSVKNDTDKTLQKKFKRLIKSNNFDINSYYYAKTNNAFNLILNLSQNNCINFLKILLSTGIDVNYKNNTCLTPLIVAAMNGRLDIIKELVKKGADVNLQDNAGNTALMYASVNGHLDVVKELNTKRG